MDGYAMNSAISLLSQDGFMAGTLQDFSIGSDGIIVGSFDNGLTRQLGQVVLATFRNYEGLVAQADNLYVTGPNSGTPLIKKAMELGAGSITAAALEMSNVDLSREFINLIISSTGFSASSRVIQTSNQLLNELMALTR
ncbi:MAG: Flagellar hook protein FlgE [Planctomycetes bacterium ADurb.Bin412]|nr:MAG: Flagellar hook protein FlgE [Planctomycetes bacterium ADurb.Bin412]